MKSTITLSLLTAAFAALTSSAAFADDQQLQIRLAAERAQHQAKRTSVAVYVNDRGVSRSVTPTTSGATRLEMRTNAHGQTFGAFVPARN
jgi:hypothetical protein